MRIRTIKPEFWMHEKLAAESEFTRLLAIALLNWADDEGYFLANPILIRGQLFPFLDDSKKVPRSIQDLSRVGWIEVGEDESGRAIGKIVNFAKHQRVDKPKPSEFKHLARFQDASKTNPRIIQDASKEEWNGKEQGKEMEGKGKESLAPTQPSWSKQEGFEGVSESLLASWKEAFPACDIKRQLAAMNAWLLANPAKAKKANWTRFITNWLARTQERGGDIKSNKPEMVSEHW